MLSEREAAFQQLPLAGLYSSFPVVRRASIAARHCAQVPMRKMPFSKTVAGCRVHCHFFPTEEARWCRKVSTPPDVILLAQGRDWCPAFQLAGRLPTARGYKGVCGQAGWKWLVGRLVAVGRVVGRASFGEGNEPFAFTGRWTRDLNPDQFPVQKLLHRCGK